MLSKDVQLFWPCRIVSNLSILVLPFFGWFVFIQTSNFIGVHMNCNPNHAHVESLACIPIVKQTLLFTISFSWPVVF